MGQANKGNKQALDTLRAMLNAVAAGWEEFEDLAVHARAALIQTLSGPKALFYQEVHAQQCAALTKKLAGPDPTPVEALLVDRIVLCWLHLHYAETIYAQNMGQFSLTQATFHQHRITVAHNRYLSAIRTLAQVRRLQVPAMQVNIAEQQLNVAAIASAQLGVSSE